MKSLNIIQMLSKLGKILSKIVFICCIVGACGCFISILTVIGLKQSNLIVEGKSIMVYFEESSKITYHTMISISAMGIIFSVCEAITAKFAENYFKQELKDGTPFTETGAKQMLNLGIICISLSLGALLLVSISDLIFSSIWNDVQTLDYSGYSAMSIGVMFIVMSFICRYGSEIKAQVNKNDNSAESKELEENKTNAKEI